MFHGLVLLTEVWFVNCIVKKIFACRNIHVLCVGHKYCNSILNVMLHAVTEENILTTIR